MNKNKTSLITFAFFLISFFSIGWAAHADNCLCDGTVDLPQATCNQTAPCTYSGNQCSCPFNLDVPVSECNPVDMLDNFGIPAGTGFNMSCSIITGTGPAPGSGGLLPGSGGLAPGETESGEKPGTLSLPNFLGTSDPNVVIGRLVKAIIGISGSIALAVFIYGGALWLFSAGSQDKIKKGKSAMTYAAIGLAIIFLSYTIVAFVLEALVQ
jgi:hypothetical protein